MATSAVGKWESKRVMDEAVQNKPRPSTPLPALMVLFSMLVFGCTDATSSMRDAGGDTDTQAQDQAVREVDAVIAVDALLENESDLGPSPCPPFVPSEPNAMTSVEIPAQAGIDVDELESWQTFAAAMLDDPYALFVATYRHDIEQFEVRYSAQGAPSVIRFRARSQDEEGSRFVVTEGSLDALFPNRDPMAFANYTDFINAVTNPNGVSLADYDYVADDERIGFLSNEQESYPLPLLRIATLFHAEDAPDLIYGVRSYSRGGVGSHGGLDLLQSRAALLFSGPGIKSGVVLQDAARLVDIAPTLLHVLGAPTVAGRGPEGEHADGLYLKWQDGDVLSQILVPDACRKAKQAVLVLFDGLLSTELNHLLSTPEPAVDLPHLKRIANSGAIFAGGALSGFPSYSAPGHVTVGTGLWPGHHGALSNRFYGRAESRVITPFDLLENLPAYLSEPGSALSLYERLINPRAENLAQAMHRAFGPYDAASGQGAFVAIINELTFKDADFNTLRFFGSGVEKKLFEYQAADRLAGLQIDNLFGDEEQPTPKLLQLSLLATDAAGEQAGPNSDLLRTNLADLDALVGRIIEHYERRGEFDETLFIVTADHGMALQDRTRRSNVHDRIRAAGVKTNMLSAGLVYLKNMRAQLDGGDPNRLILRLVDANTDAPVSNASVVCVTCEPETGFETDSEGRVILDGVVPSGDTELSVTHPGYNRLKVRL
ncbi:MAG: alkaline phosphatase family protein [Bradymonadia bacterium]